MFSYSLQRRSTARQPPVAQAASGGERETFMSTGVIGRTFAARLFNCDDACRLSVDGQEVLQVGFGEDSGVVDITGRIGSWASGRSSGLLFELINTEGAATYGFELWVNGRRADRHECGTVYRIGCRDNARYAVGSPVTWQITAGAFR